MNPNFTTSSINSPDPVAASNLWAAIERYARMLGRAAERQAKAWDNLNEAIEAGAPVSELDRLETVAKTWSVTQSKYWHALDDAKADALTAAAG